MPDAVPFVSCTLPNTMDVIQAVLVFSFGVTNLVVAINKIDTVDWDRERFDSVVAEVLGFLLKVRTCARWLALPLTI